jgi:hypothetical protein
VRRDKRREGRDDEMRGERQGEDMRGEVRRDKRDRGLGAE